MSFFAGQYTSVYSLNHHITCRFEARQALIYQLVLGLTGENDMYNYSKAVHFYPPFFDISCSAKNYKITPALTVTPSNIHDSVAFDDVYHKVTVQFSEIEIIVADSAYKAPTYLQKVFGDSRVLSTAYKRPQNLRELSHTALVHPFQRSVQEQRTAGEQMVRGTRYFSIHAL